MSGPCDTYPSEELFEALLTNCLCRQNHRFNPDDSFCWVPILIHAVRELRARVKRQSDHLVAMDSALLRQRGRVE